MLDIYIERDREGVILAIKEWNNAVWSNMDKPRDYHIKWNKSDKYKYHVISLMKVKVLVAQSSPTLCNPRLSCPRSSPGKNNGVGRHALLQGILLTQGSNLGFRIKGGSLLTQPPGKPPDITYIWNLKKKKMMQMNLFTKQKYTYIHRKQTYSYQRG